MTLDCQFGVANRQPRREVRTVMLEGGYKSGDKAKLLAGVFATLKRLAKREFEAKRLDGKMKYRVRQSVSGTAAVAE